MAGVQFDDSELRSLARRLELAGGDGRKKANDAVRKAAFEVEKGAKRRAPVDTGALRNSINTSISGDAMGAMFAASRTADLVAEVGPEVSYGVFLELGTERIAPRPFLGPAFDEVEPSFIRALQAIDPLASGGPGAA